MVSNALQIRSIIPKFNAFQKRILFVVLICSIAYPISTRILVETVFNPDDYFTFQGTAGPFEALKDQDGLLMPGKLIHVLHPGQIYALTNTICFQKGIKKSLVYTVIRLKDNVIISQDTITDDNGLKICGTFTRYRAMPDHADTGEYEISRKIIFYPKNHFPVTDTLDPIVVEVVN